MTEEKDAPPKPTGHDFVPPDFEIDEKNKSWRTMQSISEQTLQHNTFGTQLLCKLSTCNLNQFALDFDGNLKRIKQSVLLAKKSGSRLRNGSELEICGYGCEDHFLEQDTYLHSWQSIYDIINSNVTEDILCCFGMPVRHQSAVYNCFIWILNNKILLIRPKLYLANDGNYREMRYFTSWTKFYELEEYLLPPMIQKLTSQKYVSFGAGILELNDTRIATECCEEMFTPHSPHIEYALNGVEIYCNGSGSHHNLRKLYKRVDLIRGASARCGGAYLYANQQGCDGNRLYYDGCAMIINNGLCLAQATQFSIHEVEVVNAVVDLSSIRAYRHIPSFGIQSDSARKLPIISVNFWLSDKGNNRLKPAQPIDIKYLQPQEEIALGPSYWLWDYLRRSGASGYFIPLSGGADSAATATLVGIMCQNIVSAIRAGDMDVLSDVRRVCNESDTYVPSDHKELCNKILHSTYMGTTNSSKETRERATQLSVELGSYHLNCDIDILIEAMLKLFTLITGKTPQYKCNGGDWAQNLALQNIQARLRMVLSYFLAQLLPWILGNKGFLLVLGSANVDEALRGYYTKYDCSAADINPIGGICKNDLKMFLLYAAKHYGYKSLSDIVQAPPTAELVPIDENDGKQQTDEEDMGMTYKELGIYGKLRNIERCGPVSMYQKLEQEWGPRTKYNLSPTKIGEKVKYFFKMYGINRHKMTILTPSYHAEHYSPDDNRFDHRQFLYPNWKRQFNTIDALIKEDEKTAKEDQNEDSIPIANRLKRQSSNIITNINGNKDNQKDSDNSETDNNNNNNDDDAMNISYTQINK